MNNDLENLYGNNNNNNQPTQPNKEYNNVSQPQDLSSLYNSNVQNNSISNNINNSINNEPQDISVNQEGLAKMYNQNNIDLDKEPEVTAENTGPTVITKNKIESKTIVNERVTEEDLLVAYIGKAFTRIASKPFNFAAFFFNIWYLFLRKKIIYGLIITIIYLFLLRYINSLLLSLGLSLLVGAAFNGIYLTDAKKAINKIKKKNANKSMVEIRDICKKKGGLSIIYLILGFILQIVVFFISVIIFSTLNIYGNVSTLPYEEFNNIINKNKDTTYLGEVEIDKDVNINDVYNIDIPLGFIAQSDNSNSIISYHKDSCRFSLYKSEKLKDPKKLMKEMSIYYLSLDRTKNNTINKINWYWIGNQDGEEMEYHYATEKDNSVYIFEYTSNSKDKECLKNKDVVLKSIESK